MGNFFLQSVNVCCASLLLMMQLRKSINLLDTSLYPIRKKYLTNTIGDK